MYAGMMGIKEGIHVQELLEWVGESRQIRFRVDAAAALSALRRQGIGRTRRFEVKVFWTQDQVRPGRVLVEKVAGVRKPADLGTKLLGE